MQITKLTFEAEIDCLLKHHFDAEDLNRITIINNPPQKKYGRISALISDFYKHQLDINQDSCSERRKIDRTITYSEKKLKPSDLCQFLLELGRLCITWGKLNLALEIFRKVIKTDENTLSQAEARLEVGNVFSRKANWSRSFRNISEAERLFLALNNNTGIAKCYNVQGSIYGEQGNLEESEKCFQKGLSLIDPEIDLDLAANLNTNLGIIASIRGCYSNAIEHLKNALSISKELGNQSRMAEIMHNIGLVHSESGDEKSALDSFDEGIDIAKKGRFISILCLLYLAKAQVLIARDNFDSAAEFAEKALEISHEADDKLTSADIFKVKGKIELHSKNYKLSESYLLNSLRINKSLKNEMNIAETSLELAELYSEMDNSYLKNSYLNGALNYYQKIQSLLKVKEIEIMLDFASV